MGQTEGGNAMLNPQDQERLHKAQQSADLLVIDLRDLVGAQQVLLGEYATDLLKAAVDINQRLNRLLSRVEVRA